MLAVTIDSLQQTGPVWWVPLGLGIALLAGGLAWLSVTGKRSAPPLRRPFDRLGVLTGVPAWCAAGIGVALWSLLVAVVGFSWDVAWHADLGRDQALFTPPHVMILVGLTGIGLAALASIALATADRARVGLAVGRLRIPWSALPMGIMATGAVIGFPLDDYWHSVYGIDVTMWSPTHLLMIGGASLTPVAAWLMLAEAGVKPGTSARRARFLSEALAGATLIGMSTFQLEFDLGIPQWQALYHPVLVALAMGVGLVAAREALGRGGALRATAAFLVARGLIALLVAPVFGLSLERFPIYLGGALVVEAVYALTPHMLPALRVLATAVLLATAGMAVEWGWTQLWSPQPWHARLLGSWWVVVLIALAGCFLGSALGRAVSHQRQVVSAAGVAAAFAVMIAMLAVPFPRHGIAAAATVVATPAGPRVPTITRDGIATFEQQMTVTVTVAPGSAVDDADVFRVFTWQGGSLIVSPLHGGDGRYTIDAPVPVGGSWKNIVFLEKADVVAAVPVAFPADPAYGLAAIPPPVGRPRTQSFDPATAYLIRESHAGSALPAVLAYTALGVVGVTWCVAVIGVGEAMRRRVTASLNVGSLLSRSG